MAVVGDRRRAASYRRRLASNGFACGTARVTDANDAASRRCRRPAANVPRSAAYRPATKCNAALQKPLGPQPHS